MSYGLGEPKYTVEECIERDMTYAAPLKATPPPSFVETLGDGEKRPGTSSRKEVYLGDLPLLTEQGTFVVNGAERVIVSQLHRSPGVVFEESDHPNGTRLFSLGSSPSAARGSSSRSTSTMSSTSTSTRRKKFPATALLRAFGHGANVDILDLFYEAGRSHHDPRRRGGPRRESSPGRCSPHDA